MDDSGGKRKQGETREFWEEAVRLWSESGLSVREFCRREGLTEHSFYSWRREIMPKGQVSETGQKMAGEKRGGKDGRQRRQEKKVAGGTPNKNAGKSKEGVAAGFVELVSPATNGNCCCTLELENKGGTKLRVKLRGFAATDVATIGRSFWRVEP